MSIYTKAKDMVTRAYKKPKKDRLATADESLRVDMVKRRFALSSEYRRELEGEWAVTLAYTRGQQWVRWHAGQLVDVREPEQLTSYQTVALFSPLITRAAARACARRPDVAFLPMSERPLDHQAAEEMDALNGHYDALLRAQDTLRRCVTYSLTATTAYLKTYWDAGMDAQVPIAWDEETKEPIAYGMRPVGDIVEEFVPGHEVFLDPDASTPENSRWMLHVRRLVAEEVEDRYGVEVFTDYYQSTVMQAVRVQLQSSFLRVPQSEDGRVTVYEMYERPCQRYPQGRVTVCTDSQILYTADELPCGMMPLLPLGWQEDPFSPYDLSIGRALAPLQNMLNGTWSQYRSMLRKQKMVIIRQGNDGAGADLKQRFNETLDTLEVFHDGTGLPPTVTLPPMPTSDMMAALGKVEQYMSDITGIHDVSGGPDSGGGAESGVAIRMLQDSDQQMMALFHLRVEEFCRQRAIRRAKLCQEYVLEPRVWSLDPQGNTEKASIQVSDLNALRRGGMAAVQVVPGSGTPRLPEMQDEQIMGMAERGLIDPVTALKAMTSPASTKAQKIQEEVQEQAMREQAIAAVLGDQMDSQQAPTGQPMQAPPPAPQSMPPALP